MNKFAFQNNARQSHLPASLAAASSLLPLARYPPRLTPIPRASLHPSAPLHPSLRRLLRRLPPPRHPPPAVDAPWHPLSLSSGTATRATPQPYFFHSVLSIDQVLNFRVHPSRASTSSSSASSTSSSCSSCCWLLLRATPYVLFRFSSIHPRTLALRRDVRRCHPFGPHPPVPPLCLIKRTH